MAAFSHAASHTPGIGLRNAAVLGSTALVGGVILAPYVLPALGLGDATLAEKSITALCGTGEASGLAGGINALLAEVPLVGESLAKGGWTNVAMIAGIGLGGHLFANALERKEPSSSGVAWSTILRYAALATTMLIALPSILTGLSAGLVYLAAEFGSVELASGALTHLTDTLGTTGESSVLTTSGVGLAASASHLLTCGLSLFPAALAWLMQQHGTQERTQGIAALRMEAGTSRPIATGEPNALLLRLSDGAGHPISETSLRTMHERKLHVFVVDGGLDEYHHLHPRETGRPGEYAVSFVPQGAGPYTIWAEATPLGREQATPMKDVVAAPASAAPAAPFRFRPNRQATVEGLHFTWNASPPLRCGQESIVSLTVSETQGSPVALEPFLGASAHLVGFSADGKHFMHAHPLGRVEDAQPLQFHVVPEHDGPTRFFVQIRREGRILAASFDQQVFAAKEPWRTMAVASALSAAPATR